jgi:carbon-monoxide dehydrogenase medium subunit
VTRLAPFEIHRATSIDEASALIAQLGDDAAVYSGGTELLLLMKLGFASYRHLVDVKPIEELARLEVAGGALVIGGAVTHRTIERSAPVRGAWPDLAEMEHGVANVRVRTTGSLGGNLAFADPHSDPATFLLAAGAVVHLARGQDRRVLAIDEFVLGPYATALLPGELLCAVEIPALPPGVAMAHLRFAIHERPTATVSARVEVAGGSIVEAVAAVGSVGVMPVLVPGARDLLAGQQALAIRPDVLAALGRVAADASEPVSDVNGSADYKRALVAALMGRVVGQAAERAAVRSAGRA